VRHASAVHLPAWAWAVTVDGAVPPKRGCAAGSVLSLPLPWPAAATTPALSPAGAIGLEWGYDNDAHGQSLAASYAAASTPLEGKA